MVTKMDYLDNLCRWYESECNGDWEHSYGIKLETSDNPGWILTVDLNETYLSESKNKKCAYKKSDNDWIHVKKENNAFQASCSLNNLNKMISLFLQFTVKGELHCE
jgi:hypothetical protein